MPWWNRVQRPLTAQVALRNLRRMRPDGNTGCASTSGTYRAGLRLSNWWLRRYTKDVDPRYTELRGSEVTFELWEHAIAVDERAWTPFRAMTGLVSRTVLGVPRDLTWRRLALEGAGHPAIPVARLLGRRHRSHFWVPLQQGHIFDQTNGMIEPERALPYERGPLGGAGNSPRAYWRSGCSRSAESCAMSCPGE